MKRQLLPFLFAFVLPLILIFWWWGGFNSASFEETERGPYRYAYLTQHGDNSKLPERQQEVLALLKRQGVDAGAPITLLLNDPRTTPKRDWSAQVGYLVEPGAAVAAPLAIAEVPRRRVLAVSVKAQMLLAPGKAYSALLERLEQQGMTLHLPTVELYRDGVLSVEMTL